MTAIVVRIKVLSLLSREHELPPVSRTRFGSPCSLVKTIDFAVHVALPEFLHPFSPRTADYLRNTSPRWGRTWRNW